MTIAELRAGNKTLKCKLVNAEEPLNTLESSQDDLEQYSCRASLQFQRELLPAPLSDSQGARAAGGSIRGIGTDRFVLEICNNELNITQPISKSDIDISHPIGQHKDGKFTILCKFRDWKVKNSVFPENQNLKLINKSGAFNVFYY